jgi:uncharacterized protein YutE (UPF0331/DUF86 family)/predicted nucleotidyltransferase
MKMMSKRKILLLKEYFKKEPSVILAFLFGSFAKGREMEESDVDIAIYLKEKRKRAKIYRELCHILEREVDLIDLEEAPASLVSNIFKTGIPLAIKDERLYWELYLKMSNEAEDFLEFVEDFWKIYKAAKSLSIEAKERLRIRYQFLDRELKFLEDFSKLSFQEYSEDETKRRNIERWAECIINALIDIAKIVLASERKPIPKSYGDALLHFGFLVGLNKKEAEDFSSFADLRNILAHEYLEVIYERIQEFIKKFPLFYEKIFAFLEDYLKK